MGDRATRRSEGDRTVGTGVEDERDAVAVDGAAERERLLDEPARDLGGGARRLEVVGAEQLRVRGDESGAGHFERGFEQREGGELRRDAEAQDGRRKGGSAGWLADVYPWGSRRDGPSIRTV